MNTPVTVEITVINNVIAVQPFTGLAGVDGALSVGQAFVSLTQLQYDNLAVKDPNTLYDITDA